MEENKKKAELKLRGYIDLTKIPQHVVKKIKGRDGKNHLYLNIAIFETFEDNQDNDHFISCAPVKEKRQEGATYSIGYLNTWVNKQGEVVTQEQINNAPTMDENDSLPWDFDDSNDLY